MFVELWKSIVGDIPELSYHEYDEFYKILPQYNLWDENIDMIKDGLKVSKNFTYSSGENDHWMTVDELKSWISKNMKDV